MSAPLEAALAIAASGLPCFPCGVEKSPVCAGGFKVATTDPGRLRSLFAHSAATLIGFPTGKASGIIGIDIDPRHGGDAWYEANKDNLPPTRIHQTGSGGLHILFKYEEDSGIRNSASKIAPGVDVRGEGGYLIHWPSAGEPILDASPIAPLPAWLDTACRPAAVSGSVAAPRPASRPMPAGAPDASAYGEAALRGACDDLRHAHEGEKHHAINKAGYSVGGLVSAGEVLDGDAWRALNDALAEILPRCKDQRAAQRTLKRAFDEGKGRPRDVPDAPAVVEAIHPAQGMLDQIDAARAIIQRAAAAAPLAVSADLMDVGGALGQFVAYCNATAISPQPFLALAAGITAIGVLAGRKYRTRTNLRTNVYAVGIADSGGGKDHARKQIKALFAAAGVTKYMGGEDLASGTGMMTALAGHPAKLFQIDEFGDWLGDVLGPKAAPHRKQIAQRLKTLYSDAGSFVCGAEYADQSKTGKPREDIQEPHACLYGTTTPAQFWRAIAAGSLEDGLLARFFIFVSPESYPDRQKPTLYDPPAALVEAFKAISRGAGTLPPGNLPEPMAAEMVPTATAEPYTVPMTAEAEAADEAMQDHQLARQRKHAGTHVTAIAGRLAENATKLALIRAVSRNPAVPIIEAGDIAWGRALAEHCIDTLLREADDNMAETPFARNMQAGLKLIRKHGPATEYELVRKGWKIPDRERAEILRTLIGTGQITAQEQQGGKNAGRTTVRYRCVN